MMKNTDNDPRKKKPGNSSGAESEPNSPEKNGNNEMVPDDDLLAGFDEDFDEDLDEDFDEDFEEGRDTDPN